MATVLAHGDEGPQSHNKPHNMPQPHDSILHDLILLKLFCFKKYLNTNT